jgi:hypothetical protein
MNTANAHILDSYMTFLGRLSPGVKMDLISKLTQSLKSDPKTSPFKTSFGAWSGNESADEIVNGIKDSRISNRQIEGL